MLTVEVKINGNVVHTVDVVNCGAVAAYEDGDYPGGPGERKYSVRVDGMSAGYVMHYRADGALFLAGFACEAASAVVAQPVFPSRTG